MVGLTGRQCMSLSGRESGRPLVGLVLTPDWTPASGWKLTSNACVSGPLSTHLHSWVWAPPHPISEFSKSTRHKPHKRETEQGQVTSGSRFRSSHPSGPAQFVNRQDLSIFNQLYPHHQQCFHILYSMIKQHLQKNLAVTDYRWKKMNDNGPWTLICSRLKRGTCMNYQQGNNWWHWPSIFTFSNFLEYFISAPIWAVNL